MRGAETGVALAQGLGRQLSEIDGLFGVPQLSGGPEANDAGAHQLRVLEEAARARAPPAVRIAALMQKIGMAGSFEQLLSVCTCDDAA